MQKLFLSIIYLFAALSAKAQQTELSWVKQIGGISDDIGSSTAVDASGNVYTTGHFTDTVDFDPGPGIFNLTATSGFGSYDIFISKLDASGNFVWAKKVGDSQGDRGMSVTTDSGNVYVTGFFSGTADFDPGAGTFNITTRAGSLDLFILKLDTSGNFVWAKNIGGTSHEAGHSVAIDVSGNVYMTGSYQGNPDFDPGPGIVNLTHGNGNNIFILKLNASGKYVWAKNIEGTVGYSGGYALTSDLWGNVYTTGSFSGTADFDPDTSGTFNVTSAGGDIFILKLDSSGNFIWVKIIAGPSASGVGQSVITDLSGNVYTTGHFTNTMDFDPGVRTYNLTAAGHNDIFISKLDAAGNLIWVKTIGGPGSDYGLSSALDLSGNVYTTGHFTNTVDFDPGVETHYINTGSIFILKLNAWGNFEWATKNLNVYGVGASIALDKLNNIYTTGHFSSLADFDPGLGVVNLSSYKGSVDIFILKMNQNSTTSIKENSSGNSVTIYPNPANEILNVELQNLNSNKIEMQIFNSTAQLVMDEIADTPHSAFNIHHLPSGLYFVKVISENRIIAVKKLIKR